jgi:hypothetical protein
MVPAGAIVTCSAPQDCTFFAENGVYEVTSAAEVALLGPWQACRALVPLEVCMMA